MKAVKKTKLIYRTARTFLFTGLILAVLSSAALYFYTKNLLQDQVEESLHSTESRVVNALKVNQTVFSIPPETEIREVSIRKPEIMKDTIIYDPSQDEMEAFRELSTYETINGKLYQITVRNLIVESGDILIAIIFAILTIFLLSFLFLFYFNTRSNIKLWRPFFKNLNEMKKFSISSGEELQLTESDVLEFSELKKEIQLLTSQVRSDYQNLKQFTEDVSHEMQTPLAIIQAKLDNVINDSKINDYQFDQISSIQKDVQRLKSLNQRITLLTKIDNNQFVNIDNVNVTALLQEKIINFAEMHINHISLFNKCELIVAMDIYLADILINNLINNAVKHNFEDREVEVAIDETSLTISNSGSDVLQHPEKLFMRLYREDHSVQSSGLGLAIVKKICDLYNFIPSYEYGENRHKFTIKFK